MAPDRLLDPCTNVRVGAAILAANFVAASRPGRTHLEALVAALSAYHSGSETAGMSYAKSVLLAHLPVTYR
jgi:type IV secretion system protein VirB1